MNECKHGIPDWLEECEECEAEKEAEYQAELEAEEEITIKKSVVDKE